ncbi:MAG: pilus assembly protein N-terminal domain-containing protein [Acidobacteriota bacterium]
MKLSIALASIGLLLSGAAGRAAADEELKLPLGRSTVIDYPADIGRISTSNPEVVDAVAISLREVLLHGKSHGAATVVIWAKSGQRNFYHVLVEQNLEPVRKLLQETFPNEEIQIQAARDSLSLTGRVSSQAVADRAAALMAPLAKSIVNNLQVAPPGPEKQVLLRVKFAELNRTATGSFGVNLASTGLLNTPSAISTGQFFGPRADQVAGSIPNQLQGTTTRFTISDMLNVFAFRPDLNLAAFVRALESKGLLQILAEPNLVTTNGKEASFLVGGEFPVPVVQGGANVGAVTVQFREFGIRLTFNPTITAHQTIKMMVRPEVSTMDLSNSVVLSGFTIPALATRRMETNVELGPGQSFVIAGLIDDRVTESLSKIPGLAHIPILGVLFKSRQESRAKTELVVIVSPEITTPIEPGQPLPLPELPKEFLGPAVRPTAARAKAPAHPAAAGAAKAGDQPATRRK